MRGNAVISTLTPRARALRRDQTPAEALLWAELRAKRLGGHRFRRQDPIGPFIADFVCEAAKLIVELDGSQHGENADYDARRTSWLEGRGYRVLRFANVEVLRNLEGGLRSILGALAPSPWSPEGGDLSLSRSAGEGSTKEGKGK